MAKLTQDEKLERTRALLSAPPLEHGPVLQEVEPGVFVVRERIQPRPDEIGYA